MVRFREGGEAGGDFLLGFLAPASFPTSTPSVLLERSTFLPPAVPHPLKSCAWLLCLTVWLPPLDAQTPTAPSPPPGIELPATDRDGLRLGVSELLDAVRAFARDPRTSAESTSRIPDVEIFPVAVSRTLDLNSFYDVKQVASARALLEEGRTRLNFLKEGKAPWTTAKGAVVRGFRSRIDGSVQPYGIWVAEDAPAKGARLDVWLHGRGDKLSEVAFLSERLKGRSEFTPPGTLVLHPYGRFCNAYKFAGETDVLEAVEDGLKQYHADKNRVALRGFSMGGAGAWHLGAHLTSRWCVIAPGAGFAETAQYAKVFAEGKPVPPWWEQVLWRLYDAPGYVANLANRPVFAYSGEDDPQKKASDLMVQEAAREGITIPHLIGPKTGHKYHPETKVALAAKVDEAALAGSAQAPAQVSLTTFTLRYNRMDWVEITALQQHWEQASVRAKYRGSGAIELQTKGVNGLALTPPVEWAAREGWTLQCDGVSLGPVPAGTPVLLEKATEGRWTIARTRPEGLRKTHALQGPVDDAFMDSFLFVRPTGKALHPAADAWARAELERAVAQWKKVFRGDARVVDDVALTPEMMVASHVVLWGDPGSNKVLARMLSADGKGAHALPLRWDSRELQLGGRTYPAAGHAPVLIYPNPFAPKRYVVLNSSFTFRQGSDTTNALQTPKLPDWAVVDLATPPDHLLPGAVPDAGFFDEFWKQR